MKVLGDVGLGGMESRRPDAMSGGQQQRVAIARAVAARPAIILADEPTANVDSETAEKLLDLMEKLNRQEGATFLFSTHDPRVMARARPVAHGRRQDRRGRAAELSVRPRRRRAVGRVARGAVRARRRGAHSVGDRQRQGRRRVDHRRRQRLAARRLLPQLVLAPAVDAAARRRHRRRRVAPDPRRRPAEKDHLRGQLLLRAVARTDGARRQHLLHGELVRHALSHALCRVDLLERRLGHRPDGDRPAALHAQLRPRRHQHRPLSGEPHGHLPVHAERLLRALLGDDAQQAVQARRRRAAGQRRARAALGAGAARRARLHSPTARRPGRARR